MLAMESEYTECHVKCLHENFLVEVIKATVLFGVLAYNECTEKRNVYF